MKKLITAVFISLLLFMSSSHAIPSNLFKQPTCHDDVTTLPIFQLLTTYKGNDLKNGTVFLIDKDMWVTAVHVVSNNDIIELKHYIILPDDSRIEAEVIYADPVADIAILSAPSGKMKPIAKITKPIDRYEPIWNIGLPGITDNAMISFEGIILSIVDRIFLQSNALAYTGMSGGPQVRCNGDKLEVIAVIIKLTMDRFNIITDELENGTIMMHHQYMVDGSKSSPHIAKTVVESIFEILDNRQNHN